MASAVNVIYDMNDNTKTGEIARLREKAMHDETSALGNARREGIEEGMEKVIEKMRKSGMTEEQINQQFILLIQSVFPLYSLPSARAPDC